MSVYDDVKRALQDFLAPDIKEIKGDVKAINARVESIDRRFDDLIERLELKKRIERLEQQHESQKAS
jgi:hypothetical protein